MKPTNWVLAGVLLAMLLGARSVNAQQAKADVQPATNADVQPATSESQEANLRAYVELLRVDVRAQKTAIITEIMNFNDDQAAKFWPIYREYDLELQKLNDQKLAGILDYAKNYGNLTDEKANELAQLALELEGKRNQLKRTYYEKVRDQLGGVVAARFLQVENQLLMVMDLQISSNLPIVE